MIITKSSLDRTEKAENNFKNIKESIKGLYEILNLTLNKDDLYHELAMENLTGLYQNLVEMLLNDYGLRKLIEKLHDQEIDLDIKLEE
ncbi:MAG: hypothetical protein ACTSUN_04150 [Promethearchaeota archaeon]